MIDRVGLAALPPSRRAQLIYSEAQAEMSKRLWQSALGSDASDRGQTTVRDESAGKGDSFDTLMDALAREMEARRAPATPPTPSARAKPFHFPPVDRVESASVLPSASSARVGATGPIDGLGPNARHVSALASAAERTGIPAPALAAIVDAEAGKGRDGSWQVYSRNPRSSAAGLGQFLSRTWEGLAETRGTWLNEHARQQGWLGENGQVRGESRAALLASRYDATASINGIADYARRNLDGLKRMGVEADGDMEGTARLAYLGHHLGLGDAAKFIRNKGLGAERARVLLGAQVGAASSHQRIAAAGDASSAHRAWLMGYLDRKIRPERFAAVGNV